MRWSKRFLLLLLSSAGLALLDGSPARASTFTVNSTTDAVDANPGNGTCATSGGACTLRAAVMEANALAGADTITLPAGTYTLSLGPMDNDFAGTGDVDASGDLDVKNSDLTVNGAGAGSTIIDGNDLDRVFDQGKGAVGLGVDPPANTVNLTISNLTIRNGFVDEIYDNDPTGNSGANFADGGAIRYDGFDVPGGGTNDHTLTLTNVVLADNTAEHNGGAVFAQFAKLSMSGVTISNNTALAGEGGGVVWLPRDADTLTVANSTVSGNRALRDFAFVDPPNDPDDIVGGNGGGLHLGARGTATVTNSSFANNQAEVDGGGLYVANKAFSLTGSTFTGNKAGDDGGGVYSDPDTSVVAGASASYANATVQSNEADAAITDAGVITDDGVGSGGGVFHSDGLLTLTDSTIGGSGVGNRAQNGGGIAFAGGTSNVRKNQLLANTATAQGGALHQSGGVFTARYNRIRGNTAGTATGKGLHKTAGTLDAANNWWGCNEDPAGGPAGCDTVAGGTVNPRLVLTHTASPSTIRIGETSTLTAGVLVNSAGTAVALSDVTTLIGLPLSFGNPVLGTISGAGTSVGAGGTATATYTAGSTGGIGSADATVDSAVAKATITVHEPPEITVPADKTVTEDTVRGTTASVSWATSATGYPVPTITCKVGSATITSPHTFSEGTTTVDCTATNGVSPDDTESFKVNVQTAPRLTDPPDQTVTDADDNGSESVSFSTTVGGNPTPTVTCKVGSTTITSPHTFSEGVTTVDCTATNGIAPDHVQSFTVTVQRRPEITVPADITVTEDTPQGTTASVSWTTSATGHPTPTITCKVGSTVVTSPHTFPEGTTTVDCTATNGVSPDDTESFKVNVQTAPRLTDPPDQTVDEDTPGGGTASVAFSTTVAGNPTPTVTCTIPGPTTITSPHTFGAGTTTVTCTATNSVGTDTEAFTVTVKTRPTITVPANITVTEDTPHGGTAGVTWTTSATGHPAPTITCKVGSTVVTSPHTFGEGTTTVTCTATNSVGSDSKSFTVTVNTLPTITVPANITVNEDTAGGGTASVSWTTSATGHPAPTIACKVGSTTVTSPHTFGAGTTTVTCTATNSVGSDSKSFDVTVRTAPRITVPADMLVDEDTAGGGTASVSWTTSATGHPTPSITCTIPGPTTVTSPHTFPGGTTTVTCTATNSAGSATDAFDVTVNRTPVADAGGPYSVAEGAPLTLDGSGSSDPDGDALALAWDIDNDGQYDDATGTSPTFTWAQLEALGLGDGPAVRTIRAQASDPRLLRGAGTGTVDIVNVPPQTTVTPATSEVEFGAPVTLKLGADDPSTADDRGTFGYAVDWGDGSTETLTGPSTRTASHTYAADGTYTVAVAAIDKDGGVDPTRATATVVVAPDVGSYWLAASDGGVFAFGGAAFHGSLGGTTLNAPIVGIVPTPSRGGYWLVGADGGVFAFGDAVFRGSMAGASINRRIVGMVATPSGGGYWLVASDGWVFAFGDAVFHGSMAGKPLNGRIVGMAATPSGGGYWLIGADGGVFAFGDARFHGSMGGKPLNGRIVGMTATPSGGGYWLIGADGGVFAFGDARFHGSMGGKPLNDRIVGAVSTPTGGGYWLIGADGGVFAFGDAQFEGSMGGKSFNGRIVGGAVAG